MKATLPPATSRPSDWRSAARQLLGNGIIWLVILAVVAALSLLSDSFLSWQNLRSVLINMTHVAILAYGLTFVFVSGGFDLSGGAVLILAATVLIALNPIAPLAVAGVFLLILALGAFIGAANGFLAGAQKLSPFVVTLAMRTIIGSVIFINAASAVYGFARQGPVLEFIGIGRLFGVLPVLTAVLVGVTAICWFILSRTLYGRKLLAVGTHPAVAHVSGLRVSRLQMSAYVIYGLLASLAGILVACKTSYLTPSLVWHYDFDAITACALGGVSMSGGRGGVFNALSGVILLALINNGMVLLGVPPLWQPVLKGVVLLAAIIADMQGKRSYA